MLTNLVVLCALCLLVVQQWSGARLLVQSPAAQPRAMPEHARIACTQASINADESSRLAPLTQWVQSEIHRHQHPTVCSPGTLRYTDGWVQGGFGSEMHVTGSHLAHAIENGWILEWGGGACGNLADAHCDGGSKCACFFQPLSNCSGQGPSIGGPEHRQVVPTRFKEALARAAPGMTEAQTLYWWRAQSVAYLMRINAETRHIIAALRLQQPRLPPGTINAHIRAGDKHVEMALVPPARYAQAAEEMVSRSNPLGYHARTLFVSGDDEALIREAVAHAPPGWRAFYSEGITRMPNGFVLADWRGLSDKRNLTNGFLVQLLMSLEADAWIGTRGSNWNRLIDELRCVWVPKCDAPYAEVGSIGLGNYEW